MKFYDWLLGFFGVSGWAFSFYLLRRFRSSPNNEVSTRTPRPRGAKLSVPSPVRTPSPEKSEKAPSRENDSRENLLIHATDGKKGILFFGRPKYVLACVLLLAVVIGGYLFLAHTNQLSGPGIAVANNEINTGDFSFIKITNASESKLPTEPDWKTTRVKTGEDGKGIEVIIGVLWDPYRWVKGNAQKVAIDLDENMKYNIEDVISTFQNDEKRPIIVVGMASHENAKDHPEEEISRAGDRADKLVDVCSKHFVTNRPHIYSLNLGAYKPDKNPSIFSASERRVVLLVISQGENNPNLTAEVKKALIKARDEQNLLFDARDYSLFDDARFQVSPRANF